MLYLAVQGTLWILGCHFRYIETCWLLTKWSKVYVLLARPPSSFAANYRPISITSTLSKVFERLVSVRLGWFMERNGVLPTKVYRLRIVDARYSANSNTAETLKNVTSLCWQKRKQTIAMIEVYLASFNIFSKKCVNVNGCSWYETSKYLLAVLTNRDITSSASYYQVSKQLLLLLLLLLEKVGNARLGESD